MRSARPTERRASTHILSFFPIHLSHIVLPIAPSNFGISGEEKTRPGTDHDRKMGVKEYEVIRVGSCEDNFDAVFS